MVRKMYKNILLKCVKKNKIHFKFNYYLCELNILKSSVMNILTNMGWLTIVFSVCIYK